MSQKGIEQTSAGTDGARLRVFYDGGCPLCRREIAFLKRRDDADRLDLVDISIADGEVAPGLSCRRALARMHVATADGRVVSGARAFLEMWGAIDRYRPVVRVLKTPPLPWLMEGLYRVFLVVRPALQGLARRMETGGR